MEYKAQMDELLDELQKETGMRFEVTSNENDERETLRKLTKLIHRYGGDKNKAFFFKEYLTGDMSEDEIRKSVRKFRMNEEAPWSLFYISFRKPYDTEAVSVLMSMYATASDHLVEEDATHIVLLRQLRKPLTDEELHEAATDIHDTLESELMMPVRISYDGISSNFYSLRSSYEHSKVALDIRNTFHLGMDVINYHQLGLGKLVYSLPPESCREFIDDHFGDFDFEQIDSEMLHTIDVFFDSGLSIAETARELFVHRNTLVYRLDKIEKLTGLDVRKFSDAVILQIALLMRAM